MRLISATNEQLGVMPLVQALQQAEEQGVDLVEVAPEANPPVCRLMDYGKYRYEQARKEKEARKSQKTQDIREVRLRPQIDEHDIEFKMRTARKLLQDGDRVKITVMFRGREMAHTDLGASLLKRVVESLQDMAKIEKVPEMEGRRLSLIVAPLPQKKVITKPVQEAASA